MASSVKEEKSVSGPRRFFSRISRAFKDMRGEMKRVVWPSKKTVIHNTLVVLVFMVIAAIVVGIFDTILSQIIRLSLGG